MDCEWTARPWPGVSTDGERDLSSAASGRAPIALKTDGNGAMWSPKEIRSIIGMIPTHHCLLWRTRVGQQYGEKWGSLTPEMQPLPAFP